MQAVANWAIYSASQATESGREIAWQGYVMSGADGRAAVRNAPVLSAKREFRILRIRARHGAPRAFRTLSRAGQLDIDNRALHDHAVQLWRHFGSNRNER